MVYFEKKVLHEVFIVRNALQNAVHKASVPKILEAHKPSLRVFNDNGRYFYFFPFVDLILNLIWSNLLQKKPILLFVSNGRGRLSFRENKCRLFGFILNILKENSNF